MDDVLLGAYSKKHDNIAGSAQWVNVDDELVKVTVVGNKEQIKAYCTAYPDAKEVGEVIKVVKFVDENRITTQ